MTTSGRTYRGKDDAARDEAAVMDAIDNYYFQFTAALPKAKYEETLRGWASAGSDLAQSVTESQFFEWTTDLLLFTPSMSGSTAMDRLLRGAKATTPAERAAVDALGHAQFRLLEVRGRVGVNMVGLTDLATGELVPLLDEAIPASAVGIAFAARIVPLPSGRFLMIGRFLGLTDEMRGMALSFVRPGKGLGNGYRCAAALYKDAVRHGALPEEILGGGNEATFSDLMENLTQIMVLGATWSVAADTGDQDILDDLALQARGLADVENLVDALGQLGQIRPDAPAGLAGAYESIIAIQMETMLRRAAAGLARPGESLEAVARAIDGHIGAGRMERAARSHFDRISGRISFRSAESTPDSAEVDRVIQRIKGLRSKTLDQGCTEEEALAAAAKVAELLDRYGLTLDAATLREEQCEGLRVETDRKRTAPVDDCLVAIAGFCDCRVWRETTSEGTLRAVFFGLRPDVAAAGMLHQVVEAAFDSETDRFRGGDTYGKLAGGDRRSAANSFQIGLAHGISGKLSALRSERQAAMATKSGRDLVPLKASIIDEEFEALGLDLTSKKSNRTRRVNSEAYRSGHSAGVAFEPHRKLG